MDMCKNLILNPFCVNLPNEPIEISTENVEYRIEDSTTLGKGKIQLKFLPRSSIELEVQLKEPASYSEKKRQLFLLDRNLEVPGILKSFSGTNLTWVLSPEPLLVLGDSNSKVNKIIFNLVNFSDFNSLNSSFNNKNRIYHLCLKWNGYIVHIHSLSSSKTIFEVLKRQGGFGVTHIGEIIREDGKNLDMGMIDSILEGVRLFFSFARGKWSVPVLLVGYDKRDNKVWEQWNSFYGDSYANVLSWFDLQHGQHLESLFPGFMNLFIDENWNKALKEALYWYLLSNSIKNVNAGIILTQTAIESLSFTYCVEIKKLLSDHGFNQLSASERFRILLASLDIPLDIPTSLNELLTLQKQFNWIDAPQGLTEIRNDQVHPQKKNREKYERGLVEARNLNLWYLEMVILCLCDYRDEYSNRLKSNRWVGQVEKLPWKK